MERERNELALRMMFIWEMWSRQWSETCLLQVTDQTNQNRGSKKRCNSSKKAKNHGLLSERTQ